MYDSPRYEYDGHCYKFTGEEWDSESGLDYFGARYYASRLGRFVTPDWAAKATAVPYADFSDPQNSEPLSLCPKQLN